MPFPVDQLDFDLAWRRTKSDLQNGRVFVHSPLEVELVEADLKSWLERLRQKVQDGYQPDSAVIADIPKGNGAVRPGAMLSLEDRVVYSALIGALLPMINKGLIWSQGVVDFSYRLSGTPRRVEWFTNTFNAWTAFRKVSLEKIDKGGATHIVVTDITGFYENIDLSVLFSDLRNLGCPEEITQLLSRCLNRWCVLQGRGLPQGLSASDILSKVYLNPIDRTMIDSGIDFIRYVDDIRIFCLAQPSGKTALMSLAQLLRRRGLNLQSAKTSVTKAEDVREKIEGVNPLINKVQEKYQKQLREFIRDTFPSVPVPEPTPKGSDAPPEIIREIFREHFLKQEYLDKTLLHFLLKRLGDRADNIAVGYCLNLIGEHPQETDPALQYLATARADFPKIFAALEKFLASSDNIYDFQAYQIFRWLDSLTTRPTEGLIAAARHYTFDNAKPSYLRSVCRVTLQNHGTFADLERLEGSYGNAHTDFERAQTIVSIKRMEAGRRNAFYGRVSGDGFLCERACRLVRENRL